MFTDSDITTAIFHIHGLIALLRSVGRGEDDGMRRHLRGAEEAVGRAQTTIETLQRRLAAKDKQTEHLQKRLRTTSSSSVSFPCKFCLRSFYGALLCELNAALAFSGSAYYEP